MSSKLFGCKLAFFVTALTCLTGSFVAGQEEPTLQTLSSTRTYERCSVYSYSCVDKKNKCKGDFYSYESMERCNNGNKSESCCKMPLHCSNTTGKCVADNSGDSCTSDSDCLKNYFGSGLNVCLKREGAQALCVVQGNVGDSCLINDDCYGPMQCVAGVCEGADEGNVCAPTVPGTAVSGTTGFSCKVGLYCDPASLVCKPRVAAGERCSYNYMCGNGLVCNSGECTPRYSLSANDNCSNDDACEMGLLCNEMNECAKGMDYKLTECKSDADCVFGSVHGTCDPECHHAQGKHFCLFPHSSECKEAYNEAYKCLENNGCPLVLSFVRGSCAYTSCKKAVAKVYGCKSFCGHYRSLLEGCTEKALKDRCPLFSKAVMFGSTLGVFVGIIAILITTFILARVLKTEDPYAIITDAQ